MASFWDRVKAILGSQPSTAAGGAAPSDLARQVEAIVVRRMTKKELFEPIDIADEATATVENRTVSVITYACSVVEQLYDQGKFTPLGYTRTKQADGNWLYHPKGADPPKYTPPPPAGKPAPAPAPVPSKAPAPTPAPAPAAKPPSPKDPLDA